MRLHPNFDGSTHTHTHTAVVVVGSGAQPVVPEPVEVV